MSRLAPGVEEIISLYAEITSRHPDPTPAEIRLMDAEIRTALDGLARICEPRADTVKNPERAERVRIPTAGGALEARLHRPQDQRYASTLVFWHGGGWVCGSPMSVEALCAHLADRIGVTVLNAGYRLAPEFPFPHALDDAAAAIAWVRAHSHTWGGDGTVVVGGESAGANLAAAVAGKLRDADTTTTVAAQLLLYPALSPKLNTSSARENSTGYELTTTAVQYFWDAYLADTPPNNPLAAPLEATDHHGLPTAVIAAAEFDPLRDDAIAYSAVLERAGVPVSLYVFDGLIHGFARWAWRVPRAMLALEEITDALAAALGRT